MKTLLIVACGLLGCIPALFAQSVSGLVTDGSGRPIEGAAVSLLSAADSSWQRSELSDASGRYRIQHTAGDFLVEARAGGYAIQLKPCRLAADSSLDLDFSLQELAAGLDAVTVTARRPFIEAKPGMTVVNIEGSPVSTGSSALELLRRAPGVQVSPEGEVSLRGRNGVQVYVDGRPSRLAGEQLTALLRSMTAEEIAQLELITQPGARYDAAGTAGIVNIRTRSVRKRGLNGSFSATGTRATDAFGNLAGRLTYRHNRLTMYAGEYFNYVSTHNRLSIDRRLRNAAGDAVTGLVQTEQHSHFDSRFHRLRAGAEYALSERTTIGVRGQLPFGNPVVDLDNRTSIADFPAGTATHTRGSRHMRNSWSEQELGLLARHRFAGDGELSIDGFTVLNRSGDRGLFEHLETTAQGLPTGPADLWFLYFPVKIRLTSVQADYTQPLSSKLKLETGLKYAAVHIDYAADFRVPDAAGNLVADTLRSSGFRYDEAVPAAYGTLSYAFHPKLDLSAGLRAEQTVNSGRVRQSGEAFDRSYLSLFPTVFASFRADSLNTVTFSYGRRLDRPNYQLLNPARDYIDKYSYRVGNPRLMPQFVNNFELGYSYKGQLNATLLFMQADGIISDYFVQDDQTKISYEVHDNIAGFRQAGINASYNRQWTPWWTMNLYGDAYLLTYTGAYAGVDYKRRGSSFSFNLNNQFSWKKGWGAELSGWFNGPALSSVFSESAAIGSLDMGVSRKMLSDTLVVKLAFIDVLGTQRYRSGNRYANVDTDVAATWDARRAAISLNYNFGTSIELMQRKGEAESRRM